MHQSLHALSLHRPYPWQPQVLWDTNRPRQSTGSITYLASVKQALLLEDEWMAKSLASALETSAAKELYLFLRMAFCICPVSASTDSPHCFWMTRLSLALQSKQHQLGSPQNIPSLWQWASYLMETEVGHLGVASCLSCCCCHIFGGKGLK